MVAMLVVFVGMTVVVVAIVVVLSDGCCLVAKTLLCVVVEKRDNCLYVLICKIVKIFYTLFLFRKEKYI